MTRGVISVPIDLPVTKVADVMIKQKISGVAVTDHSGEVMGVISEMDILKAVLDENLANATAESIMTAAIQTVKPSSTLKFAANVMLEKGCHRLLVLSETGVGASDRPVGIISARDIVRKFASD